jgi:hypothetical protein
MCVVRAGGFGVVLTIRVPVSVIEKSDHPFPYAEFSLELRQTLKGSSHRCFLVVNAASRRLIVGRALELSLEEPGQPI